MMVKIYKKAKSIQLDNVNVDIIGQKDLVHKGKIATRIPQND